MIVVCGELGVRVLQSGSWRAAVQRFAQGQVHLLLIAHLIVLLYMACCVRGSGCSAFLDRLGVRKYSQKT